MQKKSKQKEKEVVSIVKVQLMSDRVLIAPEDDVKKTASGIYIPDTSKQEKPTRGTVIAVGPGRVNDDGRVLSMTVKVGQQVYFSPGWESEIEIDETKYYLIHEGDVKAIIK